VDPATAAGLGVTPADILYQPPPLAGVPPVMYATQAALDLLPGDDVDALVVYDEVAPGLLNPGDIIYVSLAPGSPTLGVLGATPGDVIQVYPGAAPFVVMGFALFDLLPGDDMDGLTISDPAEPYDEDQSFRIHNHSPETVAGAGQHGGKTFLLQSTFDSGAACVDEGWTSVDLNASGSPGYGDFAGLYNALTVVQADECVSNLTCVWGFFSGSTVNYGCGGYPGQLAVPYVDLNNRYIKNEIWSPNVPLAGTGNKVELSFDVYSDLALDALVFYRWRVRSVVGGAYGEWRSNTGYYYGRGRPNRLGGKDWIHATHDIGSLIDPGASDIQVALGVYDLCETLCGQFGTGACHSHAPLFDNVEVIRENVAGPQWNVRETSLFLDAFPDDGTVTGKVRADVISGDEATIRVADRDVGLATDFYTGVSEAVYLYVAVWPQGQPKISGTTLTDDMSRFPVVDSVTCNNTKWYCIRTDQLFHDNANRTGRVDDWYTVDLRDDLFLPGDTVCFFFGAENTAGIRTYWSQFTETTDDFAFACVNPMEFTCLPANALDGKTDVLYVDAFDFRGGDPPMMDAFRSVGFQPDRLDVRDPSAILSNGLGTAVYDVFQQLLPYYRKIVWNAGDLPNGTMGDGSLKQSDDTAALFTFIDNLSVPGGLYLAGDHLPSELQTLGSMGPSLRGTYINYSVVSGSHRAASLSKSPLVIGEPGSCFDHVAGPDTMIAYGGCAPARDFDVIIPQGPATQEMRYHYLANSGGAVVAQSTVNSTGAQVGVILSGFAFDAIRTDHGPGLDRREHLYDILNWLANTPDNPTGAGAPALENSLGQNYPNPFNPVTAIEFSIREAGPVTLRVYNAAGQLVKTLVGPGELTPSGAHAVEWDGLNDRGSAVSSGVYFYRIEAPGFTKSRKMVLLK
jgi:hypothetical protein